jgi:hypothetical protein
MQHWVVIFDHQQVIPTLFPDVRHYLLLTSHRVNRHC